jgi:hypothetical protein
MEERVWTKPGLKTESALPALYFIWARTALWYSIRMQEPQRNSMGRDVITQCPICSGESLRLYETQDHHGGDLFEIRHCQTCTVEFIANPPADLSPYYENHAGKTMAGSSGFFDLLHSVLMDVEFKPVFRSANFKKVCVLGAGSGSEVRYLLKRGMDTHAVDFQMTYDPSGKCIQADLNDPAELLAVLQNKNFDLVSVRHVLEHLKSPKNTLSVLQAARIRYVNIIVPNGDSIFKRIFGQYWCHYDPPRHLFVFNLRSLESLIRKTPYRIRFARFYGNDEIFVSLFRILSLKFGDQKLFRVFMSKSILSSVASVLMFLFARSSVQVLLELKED